MADTDAPSRGEVAAKLEAVQERLYRKIDRMEAKLDAIKVPSIWQIAGLLIATVGFVFGILAYASDRFDGGLAARGLLAPVIEAQKIRDTDQDQKLDQILEIVEQLRDEP